MSAGATSGDEARGPLRGHWTVLALTALAAVAWCCFAASGQLLEPLLAFLPGLVVGPLVAGWLASRRQVTGREAALVLAAAHALIFGGAAVLSVALASSAPSEAVPSHVHLTLSVYAEFGAWFGAAFTCGLSAVACLRPIRRAAWLDSVAVPTLAVLGLVGGASCAAAEPWCVGLPSAPVASGVALALLAYVTGRSGFDADRHRAWLARLFGALTLACGAILDGFLGRNWGLHRYGMSANRMDWYAINAAEFQQEQAETHLLVAVAVAIAAASLLALLRSPKFSARGLVAVGFVAVLGASTLLEHEVWARHAMHQRGVLAEVPGQPVVEPSLTIEPLAGPLFGYHHPVRKDATGPRRLLEPALVRALDVAPDMPIGALELPSQ